MEEALKTSEEKEVVEKKGRFGKVRKVVIPVPKGKDIVGVSRRGVFFKRKKKGIVSSELDSEVLDSGVSDVSGDVVVVDEVEDISAVSRRRPRIGLRLGKKDVGFVGVDTGGYIFEPQVERDAEIIVPP